MPAHSKKGRAAQEREARRRRNPLPLVSSCALPARTPAVRGTGRRHRVNQWPVSDHGHVHVVLEARAPTAKHKRLSVDFDEVMGLGEYAVNSRVSSSAQGIKESTENSHQSERSERAEEDVDDDQRRQDAIKKGGTTFPGPTSHASDRSSSAALETSRGEGRDGTADDVLDGVPAYPATEEEEDEDWHFSLPMGTLEDDDIDNNDGESTLPADGNLEPKNDQRPGKVVEAEMATETADDSSQVLSNGGVVERSKESDTQHTGESCSEPAEPRQEATVPDPPLVSIKDEPIDEGYDAALLPQSSISKIKEELEHQEEELRISSVFSVRGGNTFAPPPSAPVPAPQPTTIFIPSRGALLQGTPAPPLVIRPALAPAPAPASLPGLVPPARQPQPLLPAIIRCCGCSKILVKGQTAFQRKGSTQLFCSTVCLSSHLPPTSKARICYQCNKEIHDVKQMVIVPLDSNNFIHYCSHFCLSVSKTKKKTVAQLLEKRNVTLAESPIARTVCIVCKSLSKIEHEVTHQGLLHRLCSDACFLAWRKSRQLAMNCCEGCGLYCKSDSDVCQTLTIEKTQLNFCSPTCIGTYKQTCSKNTECANCHKSLQVSSTSMERDQKGKVQLYCSTACVEQSRPPKHTLTGTPFPCSNCEKNAVPQYHLATVDGNIRNFCSYDCVSVFRLKKMGDISQPNLTNGTTSGPPTSSSSLAPSSSSSDPSLRDAPKPGPSARSEPESTPVPRGPLPLAPHPGPSHSLTSVPPLVPSYRDQAHPAQASSPGHALTPATPPQCQQSGASNPPKLTCVQCRKGFDIKPLLFSYQGGVHMFCDKACREEYKRQRSMVAPCERCKLEHVVFEVTRYNQQELVFCSHSCKQQFKDDVAPGNKEQPWRPCTYCCGVSQKMLHSHYSGKIEEFCTPHCMSQYTVLYYGMARCDSCRKQGYMGEKLQCSGSVRVFCNLPCLLHYCHQHFEAGSQRSTNGTETGPALPAPRAPTQPHHSSKMNPVIADVVSLASGSAVQPHTSADSALTGALPTSNTHGKNLDKNPDKNLDKNLDNASTQTDAMRLPAARRCLMKNKSVLCRPFTLDQETMCQLPEQPATSPAEVTAPDPGPPVTAQTSAEPGSPPAAPAPPEGDAESDRGLPTRLTGRHFLGARPAGHADCVVCGERKRKRDEGEGEEERGNETGKKRRTEDESAKEEDEEKEKAKKEERTETRMDEAGEMRGELLTCCEEQGQEEAEEGGGRRQTSYYCKTCPGQPVLCPVPCFEHYHTKMVFRLAADPGTPAS